MGSGAEQEGGQAAALNTAPVNNRTPQKARLHGEGLFSSHKKPNMGAAYETALVKQNHQGKQLLITPSYLRKGTLAKPTTALHVHY